MLNEWEISYSWWEWKSDSLLKSTYFLSDIEHSSFITLEREFYSWSQEINSDFLICHSRFINKSELNYSDVYIGFYLDFNMTNLSHLNDRVGYLDSLQLAYMYDAGDSSEFMGVKILSSEPDFGVHYFWPEGIPFEDRYYYMILTYLPKPGYIPDTAGSYSVWINTGPYYLAYQDSVDVTYGIVAGENWTDFLNNAARMEFLYDSTSLSVEEQTNYNIQFKLTISPNPCAGRLNLISTLPCKLSYRIINISGQIVGQGDFSPQTPQSSEFILDLSGYNSGIYLFQVESSGLNFYRKLIILK
ncbi:MAG: hypothetical protein APR63_05895 [Desulfuromonas sp. SDB]|nr:MAG: hypothetical protein APR63_05895 [Desulfuromonas sp. SDB]